jgi:hypothetical protein
MQSNLNKDFVLFFLNCSCLLEAMDDEYESSEMYTLTSLFT